MKKASHGQSAYCLDCDGKITLNHARVGQVVTCPHCKVQLEIVSTEPVEFYWMWAEDDDEAEDDGQA